MHHNLIPFPGEFHSSTDLKGKCETIYRNFFPSKFQKHKRICEIEEKEILSDQIQSVYVFTILLFRASTNRAQSFTWTVLTVNNAQNQLNTA